jgi:hypothetical protein
VSKVCREARESEGQSGLVGWRVIDAESKRASLEKPPIDGISREPRSRRPRRKADAEGTYRSFAGRLISQRWI